MGKDAPNAMNIANSTALVFVGTAIFLSSLGKCVVPLQRRGQYCQQRSRFRSMLEELKMNARARRDDHAGLREANVFICSQLIATDRINSCAAIKGLRNALNYMAAGEEAGKEHSKRKIWISKESEPLYGPWSEIHGRTTVRE
jgi:hypothetical protein